MAWLKFTMAVSVAFLVGACEDIKPSAESENLQKVAVPILEAWSRGQESNLNLSNIPAIRRSDRVCLVPEYQCIGDFIETSTNINAYSSSSGRCVPENRVAILVIRAGHGHAAIMDRSGAFANTPSKITCVRSSIAFLQRGVSQYSPTTVLEK